MMTLITPTYVMKIGWQNLILTIPSLAFIVCFEITGYYDLFFKNIS